MALEYNRLYHYVVYIYSTYYCPRFQWIIFQPCRIPLRTRGWESYLDNLAACPIRLPERATCLLMMEFGGFCLAFSQGHIHAQWNPRPHGLQ